MVWKEVQDSGAKRRGWGRHAKARASAGGKFSKHFLEGGEKKFLVLSFLLSFPPPAPLLQKTAAPSGV